MTLKSGRYSDRRTRNAIDCSQTIWIFATNAVDNIILDFCEVHKFDLFEDDDQVRQKALISDLTISIKKQLKSEFGVRCFHLCHVLVFD
jgi:ATP-dependent Clp protease ATP-binding subunit ClpA